MVSREVRIKDAFKPFLDTVTVYQEAVSFLIDVVNEHYVNVCGLPSQKAMTFIERLVHSTSTRKALYPSFDTRFHKLPSYLRRAAIMEAVAAVTLYRKNLSDWGGFRQVEEEASLQQEAQRDARFLQGQHVHPGR